MKKTCWMPTTWLSHIYMYIEAAIERCFTKEGSPKSCSAKGFLQ